MESQFPENAKDIAAAIFDYIKDYSDVDDLCSESDKLSTYRGLGHLLQELEEKGAIAHYAIRSMKITGKDWIDKTPMRIDILYVVVDNVDKEIKEIMSPKKINLGF